ncbi:MAG TPA: glutathione S-transferase [Steroidobacteraceae bacterium]|nr:glutathione S-transferase [Steroidobacteraceae bacterium]
MYELHIANKNYSSWSLRPWVLMRELGIEFEERLLRFGDAREWDRYRKIAPAGKVPCLVDEGQSIWDSLAITEYLAERHSAVWPMHRLARAWARSAAAEMHSGFTDLRRNCSMTCGVRIQLHEHPAALARDLTRMAELWRDGLDRFGGPYLAGSAFTAVDAFFAPVAFRIQTYALALDAAAASYAARLLALPSMRRWYADALAETFRDEPHEAEMRAIGRIIADERTSA